MTRTQKSFRSSVFVFLVVFVLFQALDLTAARKRAENEIERVEESVDVLDEIMSLPEEGLPEALLHGVHGIAVIPGVIKAAYGIGGQFGKGVFLVFDEEKGWSNPCFIKIAGGSVGWQIGVQKADVVLVFKSRKSIEDITEGKITLGADAAVVAGPVGRRAEASTDLDMEAEIYSYSISKGLFAGVSIKGASISMDNEANRDFYDEWDISPQEILSGRKIRVPSAAKRLIKILNRITGDMDYF
jgi:lipid-binding SYLF domain-containing protein